MLKLISWSVNVKTFFSHYVDLEYNPFKLMLIENTIYELGFYGILKSGGNLGTLTGSRIHYMWVVIVETGCVGHNLYCLLD